MNWDDLRIIAAVRDAGSYAGAGVRLRIDETTVARRLARAQASLGVTLFDAVDGVRRPTAQCERVLAEIDAIARHVAALGDVGKATRGLVGSFRIASTSSVAEEILAPGAADFLAGNPGLTLRFIASNENVKFSRWEADLAIRLKKPERGDFTITRLADLQLYLFEPARLSEATVVCAYPSDLDATPESRHLASRGLKTAARCVTDNLRVVRSLILAKSAIGILPEHMCGGLLDDGDLTVALLRERRPVWLLVQNHLKRDRATRLVIDWLRGQFDARLRMPGRASP